jgi:hypothetical protein
MVKEAPRASAFKGAGSVAESVELGIATIGKDLAVQWNNAAFQDILGLGPASLAADVKTLVKGLQPLVNTSDWEAVRGHYLDHPQDESRFDFRFRDAAS